MKKLLALFLGTLLLSACSSGEDEEDGSLLDLYEYGENEEAGEQNGGEEEEPYVEGPSSIPDDLVLPE